jgi:hypothetical protein
MIDRIFQNLLIFSLLILTHSFAFGQTTVHYASAFYGKNKSDLNTTQVKVPGKFVFDEAKKKITKSNGVETTVWKIISMNKDGDETTYHCETKWFDGTVVYPTIKYDSFYLTLTYYLTIDDYFESYYMYSVVE